MRLQNRNISGETRDTRTVAGGGRLKAIMVIEQLAFDLIYGSETLRELEAKVDLISPPMSNDEILALPSVLSQAEILFSGWGGPVLDDRFLSMAPNLRAVFYGGGALGPILTPAVWDRNLVLTSAYSINAIPVAEYCIATILFSLKHGWQLSRQIRETGEYKQPTDLPGCYGTTVGLVSMGMIARTLLQHLALCDLKILAYDPYMEADEAERLGIELVSLDELFRQSDVVSLHTPLLHETLNMIRGTHIASMKPGATLINTSRGRVIAEEEMLDVLEKRPDLQAVLDVVSNVPLPPGTRLRTLPNVMLTPHMAGSIGPECRRMGRFMVDELDRYLQGEQLRGLVTPKLAERSTHRPERTSKRQVAAAIA